MKLFRTKLDIPEMGTTKPIYNLSRELIDWWVSHNPSQVVPTVAPLTLMECRGDGVYVFASSAADAIEFNELFDGAGLSYPRDYDYETVEEV